MLSQPSRRIIVVDKDYDIAVDNGDHFVVEIGFTKNHRSAHFTHPNIARTLERILEFKHYHNDGSKHWEQKKGGSHYFVVPQKFVEFPLEKGYSYVAAIINGERIVFNVSGGTSEKGWRDWVGIKVSTCVNQNIKTLQAIAAVSVRGTTHEPIKTNEELEEEFYVTHRNHYLVNSAWGDWQKGVPEGMVGVVAKIGGHRGDPATGEKWFFVPKAEYDERQHQFVVDPTRHQETTDFVHT